MLHAHDQPDCNAHPRMPTPQLPLRRQTPNTHVAHAIGVSGIAGHCNLLLLSQHQTKVSCSKHFYMAWCTLSLT